MGKVEAEEEDEEEGKRRRTGGAGRGLEHQTERLSRCPEPQTAGGAPELRTAEPERGTAQWGLPACGRTKLHLSGSSGGGRGHFYDPVKAGTLCRI